MGMRQQKKSPYYTTQWDELLVVGTALTLGS